MGPYPQGKRWNSTSWALTFSHSPRRKPHHRPHLQLPKLVQPFACLRCWVDHKAHTSIERTKSTTPLLRSFIGSRDGRGIQHQFGWRRWEQVLCGRIADDRPTRVSSVQKGLLDVGYPPSSEHWSGMGEGGGYTHWRCPLGESVGREEMMISNASKQTSNTGGAIYLAHTH